MRPIQGPGAQRTIMATNTGTVRRRGTAIVEYTWQGQQGLIVVADGPKGDGWLLPGGGAENGESRMAAALRELTEETGLTPYATLYLFNHTAINEHKVYLVRATGTPGIHDSAVKALGLLLPDMTVAQISLRKRYQWPTSLTTSAKKIAQRFYDLRASQSAFFQAFDTYALEIGDTESSFTNDV